MIAEDKLAACEERIQAMGDSIAEAIDQMLKGNWVDDHGHDVKLNQAMVTMKEELGKTILFRTQVLGYSDVSYLLGSSKVTGEI